MKLYSSPFSSNARKARMAASMLGIPLDLVDVDIGKGAQREPAFLAINPMGRVPVLVDGDFVLTESAAIMAYLADTKPGNTLYPAGPRERAEVNRWLFWAASHWSPAFAALAFETFLKKLLKRGEPDPVQIKRQEDALHGFALVLDQHLKSRAWIAGPTTTLADLAIAGSLTVADRTPFSLPSFAGIQAWSTRIQSLAAWKATEPPAMPAPHGR